MLEGVTAYSRDTSRWEFAQVTQPALLVGGTHHRVSLAGFKRSQEACAGPCDVLIAEGAGHWPPRIG